MLPEEAQLLSRLRAGDEEAFVALVAEHHRTMVRLASIYAKPSSVAEDVAQEAWTGFLESLDRFEGRSSIKTWLFRILMNCARARARKEARTVPMSALGGDDEEREPAVPADRFAPSGHHWEGHWSVAPAPFPGGDPAIAAETREVVRTAIDALPPSQREVIVLRDVEGWDAADVCNALAVSDTHQRVLLHRARSRVRQALERYFEGSTRG